MEYGEDVKYNGFIPIAWWIAHAWDPCEDVRLGALKHLCAKHSDHVSNLQQQGKFDQSAEIELWNPCLTTSFPPLEKSFIDQIKKQDNERSRRNLQVRGANLSAWRILYGFGEGPWTLSRKATPQDLAIQSRWVQLNWPIHRSDGVLCPTNCLCSMCLCNCDLNDKQIKMLRRRRNSTETKDILDATISAMIDFRHYCFDIYMGINRRTNMDSDLRHEIDIRVRAEQEWLRTDRVKFFTTEREFKQRKETLASFIDPLIHPSSYELKLDSLDAERRAHMLQCIVFKDIVKVIDPLSGTGVVGRIEGSVRSTRLGTGDDADVGPDWVYIKDTWYRDNEVQKATLQEIHEYRTAVVVSDNEAGNLVDGSISCLIEVDTKHDKPLSSEHTAGLVLHCQTCQRGS